MNRLQPLVFCPHAGEQEINSLSKEGAKRLSVPYRVRDLMPKTDCTAGHSAKKSLPF